MFLFSSCAANSWRVELCSMAVMESQQHTEEVLHTHPEHLKENNVKVSFKPSKMTVTVVYLLWWWIWWLAWSAEDTELLLSESLGKTGLFCSPSFNDIWNTEWKRTCYIYWSLNDSFNFNKSKEPILLKSEESWLHDSYIQSTSKRFKVTCVTLSLSTLSTS